MESLNNGCKDVLTEQEKDGILFDLFKGKNVDASFLYKGKGAELYEKISTDKNYPFIDIEKEILQKLRYDEHFSQILDKCKYITDVGCGDGQKAIALLGPEWDKFTGCSFMDTEGVCWNGKYILEDYSFNMLDIAEKNIKENIPHITMGSSQKLNDGKHLSQSFSKNMYLFLGGTICNLSDEEIISELKNMDNNGLMKGNYILLSYFTAPEREEEIQELIKIYKSESNIKFHENGMDMLGLSKDDFEFDIIYEKDNPEQQKGPFPGKIKGILRAKKDCTIEVSHRMGKLKLKINKGDEFTLHYSRRFSEEGIENLFKHGGCNVVLSKNSGRDTVALLKRLPGKLTSATNAAREMLPHKVKPGELRRFENNGIKIKKALIGLLIAGTATSGTLYPIHKQKEREKECNNAYKEWYSEKSLTSAEGTLSYNERKNRVESLTVALQLDKLKEKDREIVTDMFNVYVSNHKTDWTESDTFIKGFWEEYQGMLIQKFKLNRPYEFMTSKLIMCTKKLDKEIICLSELGAVKDFSKAFRLEGAYFSGDDPKNPIINVENYRDISGLGFEIFKIFLNGKIYHVIIVPTQSGENIGLSSESAGGPYTTTKFNEVAEVFSKIREL